MGENTLRIGAVVDVEQLKAGLQDGTASIQDAMSGLGISFDDLSLKGERAMRQISDETKAAALSVTDSSLQMAQASREVSLAQSEVYASMRLSREAGQEEIAILALQAAANTRLASAKASLSAIQEAAAQAAAEEAEAQSLSSNVIIAGFQRMAIAAQEAFGIVRAEAAETAETVDLTATGMATALGAALGIGFAVHFVEEIAKTALELDHLSEKTGISVEKLAGLQLIVKEMGGEFDPIATGMVRLAKAQADVADGMTKPIAAFQKLGISVQEVTALKPEDLLTRVAQGFAENTNHATQAQAAITLFGRGGQALIPVLRQQGDELDANMTKLGATTGFTDDAAAAARRWTKDTADLAAAFKSLLIPVMEHVIPVIHGILAAIEAMGAAIETVIGGILTPILALVSSLGQIGKLMTDAVSGNWALLPGDAKDVGEKVRTVFKNSADAVVSDWKAAGAEWQKVFEKPPTAPDLPSGSSDELVGVQKSQLKKMEQQQMESFELQFEQQKAFHTMSADEEAAFWSSKLAEAAKYPDNYNKILLKVYQYEAESTKEREKLTQQMADSLLKINEQEMNELMKSYSKDNAEWVKQQTKKVTDFNQAQEKILSAQEAADTALLKQQEETDNYSLKHHDESMTQWAAHSLNALNTWINQELALMDQQQAYIATIYGKDSPEYAAMIAKREKLDQEYAAKDQQIMNQVAQQNASALQRMAGDFNRNFSEILSGQESFSKGMLALSQSMIDGVITNLLKEVEANQLAGLKQILIDAKTAAANSYNWASSWGGPVAGAAAAAVSFAAVMAFGSFEQGGIVPNTGFHMLHENEMVLPAHIAGAVQNAASGNTLSNISNDNSSVGETHNHFTFAPRISTVDGKGLDRMMDDQFDRFVGKLKVAARHGVFGLGN